MTSTNRSCSRHASQSTDSPVEVSSFLGTLGGIISAALKVSPCLVLQASMILGQNTSSPATESFASSSDAPFFHQGEPPSCNLQMKDIIRICQCNKIRLRKCLSIPKYSSILFSSSRSWLVRVQDFRGRKHSKT